MFPPLLVFTKRGSAHGVGIFRPQRVYPDSRKPGKPTSRGLAEAKFTVILGGANLLEMVDQMRDVVLGEKAQTNRLVGSNAANGPELGRRYARDHMREHVIVGGP